MHATSAGVITGSRGRARHSRGRHATPQQAAASLQPSRPSSAAGDEMDPVPRRLSTRQQPVSLLSEVIFLFSSDLHLQPVGGCLVWTKSNSKACLHSYRRLHLEMASSCIACHGVQGPDINTMSFLRSTIANSLHVVHQALACTWLDCRRCYSPCCGPAGQHIHQQTFGMPLVLSEFADQDLHIQLGQNSKVPRDPHEQV